MKAKKRVYERKVSLRTSFVFGDVFRENIPLLLPTNATFTHVCCFSGIDEFCSSEDRMGALFNNAAGLLKNGGCFFGIMMVAFGTSFILELSQIRTQARFGEHLKKDFRILFKASSLLLNLSRTYLTWYSPLLRLNPESRLVLILRLKLMGGLKIVT